MFLEKVDNYFASRCLIRS